MIIEKDELLSLVPHRGKMFLLDNITDYDIENWKIASETTARETCIFFIEEKGIPNYTLFEFAAQTISALTGLYAKKNNLPVSMGMVLSVTGMNFSLDYIQKDSVIKVTAEKDAELGEILTFKVEFTVDSKNAGSGKITVMLADDLA